MGVVGWAEIRAGGPVKLLHMSRVALTDPHIGVEWAKSHWLAELSFGRRSSSSHMSLLETVGPGEVAAVGEAGDGEASSTGQV